MRRAIQLSSHPPIPFAFFVSADGFSIDRIGEVVNLSPHDFYFFVRLTKK